MAAPSKSLSTLDAIAMIVGIVIGAGIFSMPPLVAGNVHDPSQYMLAWALGGLISLIGALCYAELASAYPNTGGDYYFLMRAFGRTPAFLFAWARMTVIQTGSIALPAFVVGDYVANAILETNASPESATIMSSLTAALAVICLTALNTLGVREGKWTQALLTALEVFGLLLIAAAGAVVFSRDTDVAAAVTPGESGTFAMAMVFVLYAYGGWNEAAYLSAEMRGGHRSIIAALLLGILVITVMYLLVNSAYLSALGFDGARSSNAIAADTLQAAWGKAGAIPITFIVIVSALSTANATVFTGARTNYSLGRDFTGIRFLGHWSESTGTPRNALLVQGAITLALVGFGTVTRKGVATMVDYMFPVFWVFFLLVGIALFVLRFKEPETARPFRVPLYPVLPMIFCAVCGYMLYASLAYARSGAWVGVVVLLAGIPVLLLAQHGRGGATGGAEVAPLAGSANTDDD